jgi:NADPH2:quinone reductase
MKAAFIDRPGPPESIRFGDLPPPAVGPADVLVRVAAVCVNPVDTFIRAGRLPMDLPTPFILGRDLVGVVEAVGPAVTRCAAGDRVWCNTLGSHGRQGTFAELVAVNEHLLSPLPAGVDAAEAVAFLHSGLTACLGLCLARPRPGDVLFINGGSGNVGSAVLQLARARGVRTVVTAGSEAGLEWCRSLGADRAINYRTEDVDRAVAEFAPGGVAVDWDTSGRPDFDRAVARAARGGRIVVMAGMGTRPPFPVGPFYVKGCAMVGFTVTYAAEEDVRACNGEVNRWLAGGRLRVRIDRVLPLAQAADAHRLVEGAAPLAGKIVLTP